MVEQLPKPDETREILEIKVRSEVRTPPVKNVRTVSSGEWQNAVDIPLPLVKNVNTSSGNNRMSTNDTPRQECKNRYIKHRKEVLNTHPSSRV